MNYLDSGANALMVDDNAGGEVSIRYRLKGQSSWQEQFVPIAEFFQSEQNEPLSDLDWVPRHPAARYVEVESAELAVTELSIDGAAGQSIVVRETYWNEGRSRVIEIAQQQDGEDSDHWEVIVELGRDEGPEPQEVLRLGREKGAVVPISHEVTRRNAEGHCEDVTLFSFPSSR